MPIFYLTNEFLTPGSHEILNTKIFNPINKIDNLLLSCTDFSGLNKWNVIKSNEILHNILKTSMGSNAEINNGSIFLNEAHQLVPQFRFNPNSAFQVVQKGIKGDVKPESNIESEKSETSSKDDKRPYAERRDVVYKTLVRSTRRYLWDKFIKNAKEKVFSNRTRGCTIFGSEIKHFSKITFEEKDERNILQDFGDMENFNQIL